MFEFIRHPILTIRALRHIARHLSPEEMAELDAATIEERVQIEERILRRIYPELA